MECDKDRRFKTEAEARTAMMDVPPKLTGQVPFRVYYCRTCHAFHYTSKPEMKRRN